jgi:hypothetical protein
MKRFARITTAFLVVFAVGMIGACSSDPKDPFEEWGAAQRYDEYVPPTAQPVKQGTGTLTYTAPSKGVLYVLDTSTQVNVKGVAKPRVVVAGYIPSGTEVTFNPQEKRVYAKGKRGIGLTDVDPTHAHELRFDPSAANPKGVSP